MWAAGEPTSVERGQGLPSLQEMLLEKKLQSHTTSNRKAGCSWTRHAIWVVRDKGIRKVRGFGLV